MPDSFLSHMGQKTVATPIARTQLNSSGQRGLRLPGGFSGLADFPIHRKTARDWKTCTSSVAALRLIFQFADDEPKRQWPDGDEQRGERERRSVGTGLLDQETGDQGRQNPRDVADEIVNAGPQTDFIVRRAALEYDQEISCRQSHQATANDQRQGGVRAVDPGGGN